MSAISKPSANNLLPKSPARWAILEVCYHRSLSLSTLIVLNTNNNLALLPLMIALTFSGSISLPSTLVFTGLANIFTGVVFGLPLPVQPMKAIAAVAIARRFSIGENMAAGMAVSIVVLVMSISGLLEWFSRVIPVPVVKGIQVGAGLSLVLSAGTSLLGPLGWVSPGWGDNYLWALGCVFLPAFCDGG